MGFQQWLAAAAFVCLGAQAVFGQQSAPIIQPGAPGTTGKVLSPAAAKIAPRPPSKADIDFMQGMIMHHSQAVEMTALMPGRVKSRSLQLMGKRITISQTDEIEYMKQWLRDRGQKESMDMAGMDMDDMAMPLMPGMLSPAQMKALAKAKGAAFDHLFLTGMIQHHNGALIMVKDLFDTPGAGQDPVLFDFATDIDNTQRAEIRIMQAMIDGAQKSAPVTAKSSPAKEKK